MVVALVLFDIALCSAVVKLYGRLDAMQALLPPPLLGDHARAEPHLSEHRKPSDDVAQTNAASFMTAEDVADEAANKTASPLTAFGQAVAEHLAAATMGAKAFVLAAPMDLLEVVRRASRQRPWTTGGVGVLSIVFAAYVTLQTWHAMT